MRVERLSAELVVAGLKAPVSEFYFVGDPGKNRQYGRIDLVFDHWLYPVFESVHAAEPRSIWLRRALTDGSVRFVITTSQDPWVDGVEEPLTQLGYTRRFLIASLYVWEQFRRGVALGSGAGWQAAPARRYDGLMRRSLERTGVAG